MSTAVAKKCTEGEARVVAKQMSHDIRVSAKFYQAVRGAKDAKKAFDTLTACVDEPSSSRKTPWDEENTKIVSEKFSDYIKMGKDPPQSKCKGLFKDISSKQVRDKVRTLIKQKLRKEQKQK